ncbi:MAG: aromatic amino acid hydroxylase [Bacteroidales bacterium]|nr:aromatic amino acid hydroxylase [Bacteroidales bacterium]MDN5350057.1 phenylalanine-4-hydroxylase [Bacteroidales bacterium]
MINNPVLARLPKHLYRLIIDQPYNAYTWQDHAVWRFVLRQNVDFLKDKAHQAYLDGLRKTGISIEHIPDIDTMNQILAKIGWAAVTVDGFIPPAAFMEFQAYNVLVIAADIRPFDQIEYTPAPDIIHEAAGHAPIISDPEYAEYLRYFGEIGSKAFSSAADFALYESIRHLSILKADPHAAEADIEAAERDLEQKEAELGLPSEMALIRNLHWWTVEYGLVGSLDDPKIYGAGLLSSIGESAGAMSDKVKKLPYTIDAVYYNFDITKPQPQLFVTPDFAHLTRVLDEFADRMALRKGGIEGILKAIESGNTATLVFSSGLQVSGTITNYLMHQNQPVYVKAQGGTSLSYKGKELDGHGKTAHSDGFGSPIGRIKDAIKPPRFLTDQDLAELGIVTGKACAFEFESGIKLKGVLQKTVRREGNLLLLSFSDCRVTYQDQLLFDPSWGQYDMAIGESVVSAYSGPADPDAFGLEYAVPKEKTHKINYTDLQKQLHKHYGQLRELREENKELQALGAMWQWVSEHFPHDWLLPMEMLELLSQREENNPLQQELRKHLETIKLQRPELNSVISRGLKLIAFNV